MARVPKGGNCCQATIAVCWAVASTLDQHLLASSTAGHNQHDGCCMNLHARHMLLASLVRCSGLMVGSLASPYMSPCCSTCATAGRKVAAQGWEQSRHAAFGMIKGAAHGQSSASCCKPEKGRLINLLERTRMPCNAPTCVVGHVDGAVGQRLHKVHRVPRQPGTEGERRRQAGDRSAISCEEQQNHIKRIGTQAQRRALV